MTEPMDRPMDKPTTGPDLQSPNSKCVRCGEGFHCGSGEGSCWCQKVPLSAELSRWIREQFKEPECLCPDCLEELTTEWTKTRA